MTEERWLLPATWIWRKAGEIAQIVGGGTPTASDDANFDDKGIPWITPADLTGFKDTYITRGKRSLSEKGFASCGARLLPTGTVLYSSRAPIGYCAIASNPIATNQGFKNLVLVEGIVPEFVRYYLLASKIYAESLASGTTFKELSGTRVAEINIPIAPLKEQERIVNKLDELFAKGRIARREISQISQLVERQKIAILATAVSGELTADWRNANPTLPTTRSAKRLASKVGIRQSSNTVRKALSRTQLPKSWEIARVDEVGEVILGRQRSPENHNGPYMRPYVRAANITWGGWDLSDVKNMNFDERDFNKFKLEPGDVLINEGSGSAAEVGKPAIWNGEIENCCFQNTLIAVRSQATAPEFLYYVFLNAALSGQFVVDARGVNIHHIGRAGLAQYVVPLPPIEEQREIAARVRAAFETLDKTLLEAQQAAKLLDRLETAVFDKAFRGQLVMQDPHDDPATTILELGKSQKLESPSLSQGWRSVKRSTPRFRRDKSAMTKSRQDSDVKDKPYLAGLLKGIVQPASVEDLFKRAELPLTDFYKQLAWEVDAGHIRNSEKRLEAA